MNALLKVVITLPLLALLAFCGFGFLATFEPLPPQQQWMFRVLYFAVALAALVGLAKMWRRRPPLR